jgi:hypothetical protein
MPIARVQFPDGRIGRFEVDAGTTPEQVLDHVSSHFNESGMCVEWSVVEPMP